jgi:lysophospholipase
MSGLSEKYPETRLGGVTNNWLYETMKFTDELRKNYFIFKLPMKVYTGQTEKYSDLGEMKSVCLNAANCTYLPTIASKHELLFEKDLVRTIVVANILDFFN